MTNTGEPTSSAHAVTPWHEAVAMHLRTSRAAAWRVATAAGAVAILEAAALLSLAPLDSVVPFNITVDRQTGAARMAQGVQVGGSTAAQSAAGAFLAQYVIARETVDQDNFQANFDTVDRWSSGSARDEHGRLMDRTNPASPLHDAAAATEIAITIRSITSLSDGTARVRFTTDRRDNGALAVRMQWVSMVAFSRLDTAVDTEDRLLNPDGFRVTNYRRDVDVALPEAPYRTMPQ